MQRKKLIMSGRPFKTTTSFYRKVKKHIQLQSRSLSPTRYELKDVEQVNNIPGILVDFSHTSVLAAYPIIENNAVQTNLQLSSNENNSRFSFDNNLLDQAALEIDEQASNSFEDDDDEEEQLEEKLLLIDHLKIWALKHRITHRAVNDLLSIFHSTCNIKYLPRYSRTLLHTPIAINIVKMGDGTYWHNGLKNCLENSFFKINKLLKISLIINIDGLPICRSSKNEFWPILCGVDKMPNIPIMVIGVYLGQCKPNLKPFLNFFVDDFLEISNTGLHVNGHNIDINIKCFVCDTPARAFIKGVVGFNAYHGCIKCTSIGEYENNRMSFPNIYAEHRT